MICSSGLKSIVRPHFPTCTRNTNFPQVVSVKSGVSQHNRGGKLFSVYTKLASKPSSQPDKHSSGDCVLQNWPLAAPHPRLGTRREQSFSSSSSRSRFAEEKPRKSDGGSAVAEPAGGRQFVRARAPSTSSIRGAGGGGSCSTAAGGSCDLNCATQQHIGGLPRQQPSQPYTAACYATADRKHEAYWTLHLILC